MVTTGGSTQGRKERLKVTREIDEVWETLWSSFGDVSTGRGLSCLEWCWCKRHWTASGSGSPLHLFLSPWWRSSGRGCGTPGDSTILAGRGQRAETQGWCVRSGLSQTWAPQGSADLEAAGLCISAKHGLGVLKDKGRSSWCHLLHVFSVKKDPLKETCSAPFTGLSLVWLNSETGTLEKPARKSRLLTPVTLRVWRPLQLTFRKKAIVFNYYIVIKSEKHIYSPEHYLQFPSPRSGELQVDDTSRVGNVQQLFKTLLHTNNTTWEKSTRTIIYQCKICLSLFGATENKTEISGQY